MRRVKFINAALRVAVVLGIVLVSASCKRRPLHDADYGVKVVLKIDTTIVNYKYPCDPEVMRVAFFDHETGMYMTQSFVGPTGGDVYVMPNRTYDVLVYNFDTESTQILDGDSWNSIYATTDGISDNYRTRLRTRASMYPAAISKSLATKGSEPVEKFMYDPDHLYVGRKDNVYIEPRAVDTPETIIYIDCETVVQSWIVDVAPIKGVKNIASMSAVISGLAHGNNIGPNLKSEEVVTVYFDEMAITSDSILIGKFNTFGANLNVDYPRVLSLIFTDIAGGSHVYNFDVSEQFIDNPKQYIRIRNEIVIPDPPVGPTSGGISPIVDEWNDINSTIEI